MLDILLVNDDGFEAEGIDVMFEALTAAGHDVTLVAPKEQQSGTGTAIDVDQIFQPLEIENFAPDRWFVDGTPITTTLAALDFILAGEEPDLVVSGINEGANIGSNIAISSGTVSAATEATRRGIPAIAVSADTGGDLEAAYETGAQFVLDAIAELEFTREPGAELLPEGVGLNINIPSAFAAGIDEIQGVAFTQLDATSTFDLFVGELPPDFGEGTGLLASGNAPIAPDEVVNPESEGERFLAGFITVTPIDGNWGGTESDRQTIEERITSAPDDPVATPLDILLTNDDGFDAEGILTLFNALTDAGHNVTLVAPEGPQSGRGTLLDVGLIFQPLDIASVGENQFSVAAAPRTVTWTGLDAVLDTPPDLVISGINAGENIGPGGGVSSGTNSAAVTALLRGVPAIAVSGGINLEGETPSATFATGAEFIVEAIAQLQATQGDTEAILPPGLGLSVNIPTRLPEGVDSVQGTAFTLPGEVTPLEISVGELPSEFGGGTGLVFDFATLDPDAEIDPTSEGEQFLSGLITVTPIDGDWNANDEEAAATVVDRLAILPETFAASEPVFGSLGGDELDAAGGDFDGTNDLIFAGSGNDAIDTQLGNFNRIFAGSGSDELFAGRGDRLNAGAGNDVLDATSGRGDNRLDGGSGNDDFFLGAGDRALGSAGSDRFFAGAGGNNTLTGGADADEFWIANAEFPSAENIITDFTPGEDILGISGLGTSFEAIALAGNTVAVAGQTLAVLLGVDATALSAADFAIVG